MSVVNLAQVCPVSAFLEQAMAADEKEILLQFPLDLWPSPENLQLTVDCRESPEGRTLDRRLQDSAILPVDL